MTPTQEAAVRQALEWFRCYLDKSMSRNNAEELAHEVVSCLSEALAEVKPDYSICPTCGGMAADPIVPVEATQKEPVACDKDPRGCWNVRCQLGGVCKNTHPAPAQQPLTNEAKAVLRECRNQSMKWTGQARIPESGAFGGIAQDLDWLCSQLGITEKGGGT